MTALLLRAFVKNYKDVKSAKVRENYGNLSGAVGIICNLILSVAKIVLGIVTASISVTADGLNNLSDMGSSVITLIGFKMSNMPADRNHPFGHGRIEYLSAFIVSMLIMLMGGELIISSVEALIEKKAAPVFTVWAILALAVSVAVKLWMFFFNRKLAKAIDSEVLKATAQDSLNDSIASAVILLCAGISVSVKLPFNLDAVLAIFVGGFILYSGIISAKDTVNDLLGNPPPKELTDEIKSTVLSFDGFLGMHDLIIHNYGPGRQFASCHVEVPQDVDLASCHEKIDLCERVVTERTGVLMVIHMDPIDINNKTVMDARRKMEIKLREIDERLTLHDFRMTLAGNERTNLIFDVVVPAKFKITIEELKNAIAGKAKEIDPKYVCVITFDNSFL